MTVHAGITMSNFYLMTEKDGDPTGKVGDMTSRNVILTGFICITTGEVTLMT